MCGITGIFDHRKSEIRREELARMAEALHHRGPDSTSIHVDQSSGLGLGFKRLSIIDLANGDQPFFSNDGSIVAVCNGEIYNYKELREDLIGKGCKFHTTCDVEVIPHLYEIYGKDFVKKLNGQFAIALYDSKERGLMLIRDHFGIAPLFYTLQDEVAIFGSEVKAIIEHSMVKKEVDLTGLDQVLSFPGLVSPSSMFKNVRSLKPGFFAWIKDGEYTEHEYWDLDYTTVDFNAPAKPESYYMDRLEEELLKSVKYRLNADVPVGFYLSGGLDSSLTGAMMRALEPDTEFSSFSISFPREEDMEHNESRFQRIMAEQIGSVHKDISFDWSEVEKGLKDAVYFSESPLKESYNTCSMALSKAVRESDIKVILSGEGSDEIFGGYVGYRFDSQRSNIMQEQDLGELLEAQMRQKLWGDPDFFYEKRQVEFRETKQSLYSCGLEDIFYEFDSLDRLEINKDRLKGIPPFHKRSYLDLKLRLSDHLISDHCDRVCYANSVEGRYPFLDVNLLEFVKTIPQELKLNGLIEKYILKKVGEKYLPKDIFKRQKFSFVAPGSPALVQNNIEWIQDLLSYDRIKRQGYFNPDTVERIKKIYADPKFKLNLPYDSDLLIVVLTFNIFLEVFDMPDFAGQPMNMNIGKHALFA